jgi:flagellar hook-length control protein FliK
VPTAVCIDAPNGMQAKNGQPTNTGETVSAPASVSAPPQAPAPVDAQLATLLSADFVTVVGASVTADASVKRSPQIAKPAATTDEQPSDGSDAADTSVVPDGTAAVPTVAAGPAIIVAAAMPLMAAPIPATDASAELSMSAPVAGSAAAPALPYDNVPPDAPPQQVAAPAAADTGDAAPAKTAAIAEPAMAKAENNLVPSQDSPKDVAATVAAAAEDTPRARPDRKAQAAVAKSERHASLAHTPDEHASPVALAKVSGEPAPEQHGKAPGPHEPQARLPEHAALAARLATGDTRADVAAPQAATAQANTSIPALPFNLAIPVTVPHAAMWPLAALRVDAAADSAIPVAGIAVEIVSRAQEGLRRFEIRLDPPELGRIDVRLDVDTGGKVTSRLLVERAETLDLLRRDAPQLERALQHAGLDTGGGMEFSLRDQNFAGREQTPSDAAPTRLIVPDDETVAAEAARRGYGRLIGLGGGVDIRV